ncbi:MAG: hypothetical protein HYV27_09310 [Candidatus Hydrogenedentes bacterium]|nr:hypothetical protein [Candidatus Hydrogenedentota bacterium]
MEQLWAEFNTADADANGRLTLLEARSVLPALTAGQFDILDLDNDALLSAAELQEFIDDNAPPTGCGAAKAYVHQSIEKLLSDLLLAVFALSGLYVSSRLRRNP